jgi:hypothetical protein
MELSQGLDQLVVLFVAQLLSADDDYTAVKGIAQRAELGRV